MQHTPKFCPTPSGCCCGCDDCIENKHAGPYDKSAARACIVAEVPLTTSNMRVVRRVLDKLEQIRGIL